MNGGPSIIRRPTFEKSNTEFTNSLRANFRVTQEAPTNGVPNSGKGHEKSYLNWTRTNGDDLYIPGVDFSTSGLAEERSQYDITVKLFFLPSTEPSKCFSHSQEAVSLVLKELHAPSIDLLIISFPGISFDADDDEDENVEDAEEEARKLEEMIETWRALEELHDNGIVAQIGLAEFGSERLKKFLPKTRVRPSVDQINVRDCCVVPKSLILYAKQEKIELLTHNDCTNILPKGTIRELLGPSENVAGILADSHSKELSGEIEPQWVVKYTAVVRDRGVIENKGYFAMAEIHE